MKTINKSLTNKEIYSYALGMMNIFNDNDVYMPAALAYSIQKNKNLLSSLAEEIEISRMNIIQHYGVAQTDGNFIVAEDKISIANQELEDLLNIIQEVKIYTCKIEELNDIKLTSSQMQSMLFMIYED